MRFVPDSVNQTWPLLSTAIDVGWLFGILRLTSTTSVRKGLIEPIWFPGGSTNQILQPGAVAPSVGPLFGVPSTMSITCARAGPVALTAAARATPSHHAWRLNGTDMVPSCLFGG